MKEYSIKKTWADFKKMMENKSFAYLVIGCVVLYFYAVGIIAQLVNTQKGFNSNMWGAPSKKKISLNPIIALVSIFTTSGKGLTFLMSIILAFTILTFVFFRLNDENLMDERGFMKSSVGTYGTSDWMNRKELERALEVNSIADTEGIILGKLDKDPEVGFATEAHQIVSLPSSSMLNKHVAVYGGSGSRKSRSFVRPQIIQSALRGESVIVTDPKGEMYSDTAQYLMDKGFDVKVFNLVSPEYSDSWNCLGEITKDPNKVELMAQTFADVIISNMESGDGFWDTSEMNLLKALSLVVSLDQHRLPEEKTIGAVYDLIAANNDAQLKALFESLPPGHPAIQPWEIFQQAGDNVKGNVVAGLGIKLQVLQSEVIRNIASVDDIDLEAPGLKPTAIFVIMSDQDNTLTFMSSLFFAFLFIRLVRLADSMGGACPVPVNFILDEFPNIGQIPDFTKKISTIRSRELRVAVVFQNLPQMQNRYPEDAWQEILGNCDTTLFLGCNDKTTAEFISARTGQMTIEVDSTRVNKRAGVMEYDGTQTYAESSSVGKREVLTPDEVMRMEPNEALVILRGEKPLKVNKFDYSLHPESKLFKTIAPEDNKPIWKQGYNPTFNMDYLHLENEKKAEALKNKHLIKKAEIYGTEIPEELQEKIDSKIESIEEEENELDSLLSVIKNKDKEKVEESSSNANDILDILGKKGDNKNMETEKTEEDVADDLLNLLGGSKNKTNSNQEKKVIETEPKEKESSEEITIKEVTDLSDF